MDKKQKSIDDILIYNPEDSTKNLIIKPGIQKGTIWIQREDGEGGEFSANDFYKVLNKFYNDNF